MIAIIDYGIGNLASIQNMLKKIGVQSIITSNEEEILAADKLILPGVGAFDTCSSKLRGSGLDKCINHKVLVEKAPIIGICVGMQLLHEESEEGKLPGLGWIKGKIVKFRPELLPGNYKIPHMGWSEVHASKPSAILQGLEEARFYFVHSFHSELSSKQDELLSASYGYPFTAAVQHENITGVQFHPEKSHRFGMRLFENFSKL
jgi:imidazole glycerol-phosphate synthase subunit HisH